MNHIACATVLVAPISVAAYPQQSVDKPKAQTCGYAEFYKKNGWVIPGVDGAKKAWRTTVPNRNGVYMTKLEPIARAAVIQRLSCSREHVGRLEIEDVEVGITSLSSFDVGGRIFAYNLTYGVDGIGAEWAVTFYDLDGSGRFTLRRDEKSRLVPDLLPEWARDSTARK